jgi:mitogen-activated protein kinase 15
LKQLAKHQNIIRLISVIRAENNRDLYMVFDYMETDLHRVINTISYLQVIRANLLTDLHIQYISYQLIKTIKYIHSGELIHRDLKPANLLVNSSCFIKVADFGLARTTSQSENNDCNFLIHSVLANPIMTEYVATRWYRAPEILFGSNNYSKAIDMWSIGCIIGEMIVGKAIFPGIS